MTKRTENKTPDYIYRKGKYRYFRDPRTDKLTPLPQCLRPEDEDSAGFKAVYHPLLRAVVFANDPEPGPGPSRPVRAVFAPGTIGWFVGEYLGSKKFAKLADNTQRNYRRDLDTLRASKIGHSMLHDLTPQGVDIYSGEIAGAYSDSTADKHTTLITNLWEFAKRYREFKRGDKFCPTIGRTRYYEQEGEGHLPWLPDVIDKFDAWAISDKPHLHRYRMGLHFTGQRGGDVVRMKWTDYERGQIYVVQEKTGEQVWIACPPPLIKLLDGMERVSEYIFTNSRDEPYANAISLANALKLHLTEIGYPAYTMHGLRKNAGMELALAGCTPLQIMSILGHKSEKMANWYCRQASKRKLAQSASQLWAAYIAEEERLRAEEKKERVSDRRRQIRPV